MQQTMTLAQTPFWQRFTLQPNASVDTVAHCSVIIGELNIEVFRQALLHTLNETDVFRGYFKAHGTWTLAPEVAGIDVRDYQAIQDGEKQAWAEMENDAQSAVDLYRYPITLLRLYRVSANKTLWYTRAHHIVIDGYGMMLFEQRCCEWYHHLTSSAPLSSAFKPYSDFIQEEQRYVSSKQYLADQLFWRSYLPEQPPLTLTEEDYDPAQSEEVCYQVVFDTLCSKRLALICEQLSIGWPDALVAITCLYLQQSNLSDDPVVWLPFMNRWGSVAAKIPGLMVNILPYCHQEIPLSNITLQGYLKQSRQQLRKLYCHGRYRVEQIEQDHNLPSGKNYFMTPFINVMPFDSPAIEGCQVEQHVLASGSLEGLNITFRGAPNSEQFCAFIEADINSYPRQDAIEHATHLQDFFQRLMQVDHPACSLTSLLNQPLVNVIEQPVTSQDSPSDSLKFSA